MVYHKYPVRRLRRDARGDRGQGSETSATRTATSRRRREAPPATAPGASLAALAAAFQHVTIGMAVGSPAGRLVAVNPVLARMLGDERDPSFAPEASFLAIVHPGGDGSDASQWEGLAAGARDSYRRENRYLRGDGSVLWGLVTVSALRDDDGQFAGALAQVQDITAQKTAEATLRENEARLSALVEQLPVALYRLEPGAFGDFHYVSPLFERLTGLGRDDLPASFEAFLEWVHPEDRAAVRDADELAGRTGEPAHGAVTGSGTGSTIAPPSCATTRAGPLPGMAHCSK
ncbi:MAG: PAS domain S-box protein [Chloroflexota bacterium]|nr:PAS domain S-box protein [Chloroflexota bacterium]